MSFIYLILNTCVDRVRLQQVCKAPIYKLNYLKFNGGGGGKLFYYKIFRLTTVASLMGIICFNKLNYFVCLYEKKIIYEIFFITWPVCWPGSGDWPGRLERSSGKLSPYLAHFATSAVSACGLFVAVIYLKKLSILHTSLMWSTLTLFKCVTFSLLIQTHLICSYSKNSFRKVPGICCWFFLPCLNIKSQSIIEKRKHDHKVGTYTFINIS